MGLSLSTKSEKSYSYSYSGLHRIRYMAYQSIGGKLNYDEWHAEEAKDGPEYMKGVEKFPNLMWHSDCDGEYTPDGKIGTMEGYDPLQTGNSQELLEELEFVKDNLPVKRVGDDLADQWASDEAHDAYLFYTFYDVIKDTVQNHDGVIRFN